MNERILELAKQAGMIIGDTSKFDMAVVMPKEVQFARLIVQECIELAMNERLRYSSSYNKEAGWAKQLMMIHCATSMYNYKILLQEHFGVDE